MADIFRIFGLIRIGVFGMIIVLNLIYSLSILLVPRFLHRINLLTLNICFAMICSSTYWFGYFIMYEFYIEYLFTAQTCTFLFYIQLISTCIIPFAFATLTVNRFCAIIYPTKTFFKTRKFVAICVACQWIIVCVMSLPFIINLEPYCYTPRWMPIYTVIIGIIVPGLITLIINLCIFKYAYKSSRRIRPQIESTLTNVTMGQQTKISRRDIHLLKHTILMFSMMAIGWSPIFTLVAVDYNFTVNPLIYTTLQMVAVLSSFVCVVNLFLYNHELRQYIKQKIFPCF